MIGLSGQAGEGDHLGAGRVASGTDGFGLSENVT